MLKAARGRAEKAAQGLSPMAAHVVTLLHRQAQPAKVPTLERFFKTGKGQYGEGDQFLGVMNPQLHALVKETTTLGNPTVAEAVEVLESPFNEQRFVALGLLRRIYERPLAPPHPLSAAAPAVLGRPRASPTAAAPAAGKKAKPQPAAARSNKKAPGGGDDEAAAQRVRQAVYRAVTERIATRVNNWNLVDCFVPYILGPHLFALPPADRWAALVELGGPVTGPGAGQGKANLWERRSAILATMHFIRCGRSDETLKLCERFLADERDLIHKASGWLLRELGKKEPARLTAFLTAHVAAMPRTTLRYAIERLPPAERQRWMTAPSAVKKPKGPRPAAAAPAKRARA